MKNRAFLLLLPLLLILACPVSDDNTPHTPVTPDNTNTPDTPDTPDTPETLTVAEVKSIEAELEDGIIEVSWSYDNDFTSFDLYRVTSSGSIIIGKSITEKTYTDNSYPYDTDFSYQVKVKNNQDESKLSVKSKSFKILSNIIAVTNIKASVLEFDDKIRLSWNPVRNADFYNIYRYKSKKDDTPEVFTSTLNSYDDNTALNDTPYYYKVSWISNGIEHGESKLWTFGIKSSKIDKYENNNNIEKVTKSASIFDEKDKPIIYSFSDGVGSSEKDIDYYNCKGIIGVKFINITVDEIPKNILQVDIIYNDKVIVTKRLNNGENNLQLNYDQFYYRIYSVGNTDFITSYNIKISNNF